MFLYPTKPCFFNKRSNDLMTSFKKCNKSHVASNPIFPLSEDSSYGTHPGIMVNKPSSKSINGSDK